MTSSEQVSEMLVVGRITSVFGVRGWVKVFSYTDQVEGLLDYQPWWIDTDQGLLKLIVDDWKRHADGIVVHLKDVDDRDVAKTWCNHDILIEQQLLPSLDSTEFYWHQLVGLSVVSYFENQQYSLGVVKSLMETGANDVLLVKGNSDAIDREERAIPYTKQFVRDVDLEAKRIDVIWDPQF